MNKIHFITTGGTIDSQYNIHTGSIQPLEESALPKFLSEYAKLDSTRLQHTALCMKDSRDLTESDFQNLCQVIEQSNLTHIVVTHGTFTLFDTARRLEKMLTCNNKTIVLTGAMTPLTGFSVNDAAFNLGSAITACPLLKSGVYVIFYGKVMNVNELEGLH